jgi:hypothetical protein
LLLHRRPSGNGTSIAAMRCAFIDARSARRRHRPELSPPVPAGFIAAVIH